MLGGNFITYRVLNRVDIRTVCMALFNLHDFSVTDACEEVLKDEKHRGLVPIRLMVGDKIDKLNDTQEEKRIKAEEAARKAQEAKLEARSRKKKKQNKVTEKTSDDKDDDLELW